MTAFQLAREHVQHLWRETGTLDDEVRRAAFPLDGRRDEDPTACWEHTAIDVDGGAVEFALLREGRHWVAQAILTPLVIGIEARRWPLEDTGLTAETALEPYAEGSAELHRRRPQP